MYTYIRKSITKIEKKGKIKCICHLEYTNKKIKLAKKKTKQKTLVINNPTTIAITILDSYMY